MESTYVKKPNKDFQRQIPYVGSYTSLEKQECRNKKPNVARLQRLIHAAVTV